jgi:hypothetical protein
LSLTPFSPVWSYIAQAVQSASIEVDAKKADTLIAGRPLLLSSPLDVELLL